ncbi:YHS domain-containing (seleno)protein [Dapis sp. BLCC M126]|uniref:YHS domain-containing (seleno)protein n=1 Tax=Dapis sp. BLCC M126 TaxID=3400189 RepID=UPI003CF3AC61
MKRRYFVLSLVSFGLIMGCASRKTKDSPQLSVEVSTNPAIAVSSNKADESKITSVTEPIFAENGVAIRGTDPVAYFQVGQPVQGNKQFTHNWMGVNWWFSSAKNRDLFVASPEQYAPQYGGFCAFAVANGYTAPIVPEAWSIVEGRLYLNFSLRVRARWERDIPGNIARADENWPAAAAKFRG